MNLEDLIYLEDFNISSGDKAIDILFRKKMEEVFSPMFLKKLDRVLNYTLKLKDFKKSNNVMCYTMGTKIYINSSMINSLPKEKVINYIMHEFFHLIANTGRFPEFNKAGNRLALAISRGVPRGKESDFLTGKHQDIHSNWREETMNYLCNNSINWDIATSGMKMAYKTILDDSGVFNLDSLFWKKRFGDTKTIKEK